MWYISCDTGYFSQSFRECFSGFRASLREHRTSSSDVFSERPTHYEVYTRTDTSGLCPRLSLQNRRLHLGPEARRVLGRTDSGQAGQNCKLQLLFSCMVSHS